MEAAVASVEALVVVAAVTAWLPSALVSSNKTGVSSVQVQRRISY